MSLAVAVPCAIAAAVAYGASTAVQHSAAHTGTGRADARGLLGLVRNPRWLLAIGGDGLGLVFQVIALATGPVVLIQPLLVLAVPVSLPVGWALGGPRPRGADYAACAAILGGLGAFFGLLGNPGAGTAMSGRAALIASVIALAAGAGACLAVRGRGAGVRAAVYGAVAGGWYGLVGVLLNTASTVWRQDGLDGFSRAAGLVPLIAIIVVGGCALAVTQISFQVGALAASFAANEATAPVVAVILGGTLLHENVPFSAGFLIAYLACLVAVTAGAIWLARE